MISEEANAAAEIKKDKPIMVVPANPPYSVSSLYRGEWIDTLLEDYKKDLHEKKLNIDDGYIRFIHFAQWRIDETGYGILGFITNNSYLDGLTHRRIGFESAYPLKKYLKRKVLFRGSHHPGNSVDYLLFHSVIPEAARMGLLVVEARVLPPSHSFRVIIVYSYSASRSPDPSP